jgi:uncharacterized protein (TIGR03086 family)
MSVNLRNYTAAVFGLEYRIKAVADSAWDTQSNCDEWTVRQLAGHAMGVVNNIGARIGSGENVDIFDNAALGAVAGADPLASMVAIRERVLTALDHDGALTAEIQWSGGALSADGFLGMMLPDTLLHSWDIAHSTGGDERLDETLVAAALANLQRRSEDALRAPKRFHAAGATAATAGLQAQLIAFAGRMS